MHIHTQEMSIFWSCFLNTHDTQRRKYIYVYIILYTENENTNRDMKRERERKLLMWGIAQSTLYQMFL